jgi:2,5-dihydroxypyridine 5,6-dioxygenase
MLRERIEGKWIDCFAAVFAKCGVVAGDSVAILSETQSRQVTVELSELGLLRLGCRPFHLVVPSPRLSALAPVRSTGASNALQEQAPVVTAGLLGAGGRCYGGRATSHAAELPKILAGGARVLMISTEHLEALGGCSRTTRWRPKCVQACDC